MKRTIMILCGTCSMIAPVNAADEATQIGIIDRIVEIACDSHHVAASPAIDGLVSSQETELLTALDVYSLAIQSSAPLQAQAAIGELSQHESAQLEIRLQAVEDAKVAYEGLILEIRDDAFEIIETECGQAGTDALRRYFQHEDLTIPEHYRVLDFSEGEFALLSKVLGKVKSAEATGIPVEFSSEETAILQRADSDPWVIRAKEVL